MIFLDGCSLTLDQLYKLAYCNETIDIVPRALEYVGNSCHFLEKYSTRYHIYGVNTGLGPMAQFSIPDGKYSELQYNLIRSHSSGFPDYLDEKECRAVLVSRLNTLLRGHSGVSPALLEHMRNMHNQGVIPCIPVHGGVGASGDLVQLAHLASVVIGEGECYYRDKIVATANALASAGLPKYTLSNREGLALMNGTSAMTALGALNLRFAFTALEWSLTFSVFINEIMEAFDDHLSEELNATKQHSGQRAVAMVARQILEGSELTRSRVHHWEKENADQFFSEKVQEYYSLRCTPQILGPVLDTLRFAEAIVAGELNSTSDNPVIDTVNEAILHGGNFHGDYISLEMDKLKLVMTRISMLAERQLNYLLNHKLNDKLPSFINMAVKGLNFGLQGLQFTATSTTAENQTLSTSSYIHSIPCNNDNQDIVSMGFNAAGITSKIIDNTFEVLAVEAVAVLQAADYLKLTDRLSLHNRQVFTELRKIFPLIIDDRATGKELERLKMYLKFNEKGLFLTLTDDNN